MRIGIPTEIKPDEYRVAVTPAGVRELVEHGHEVLIEAGAGEGSATSDADFEAQGAFIAADAATVFGEAEMVPPGLPRRFVPSFDAEKSVFQYQPKVVPLPKTRAMPI